jgi:hypothetical protein
MAVLRIEHLSGWLAGKFSSTDGYFGILLGSKSPTRISQLEPAGRTSLACI